MAVTTSQITITTMEGWYSGDTAPSNPLIGDLWLDTTTNEIKKWDGTNWVKQADTQGPQGPKGDSIKSRDAYWIKSSDKPDKPTSETIGNWTPGSEPPETVLNNIGEKDKFWRVYKITYSNGENEYSEYSEVELIGSYEVLNGLVQFRNGVTTTENIGGQDVTVIDGGKILTGSIDAKKIYVEDLEALKATIGGFHIGKNSIYSGNKKTIDSTERGIYFDSNGQSYFGDDKNFIRFYRSDKDNYKLQISADSLTFGSGVSVEKAFEDIKGDIQNAQNTATEAAKTADNYISADSTGIMVSENKGAIKETPSNATKNNVLITDTDVQIRNGKKTVASYGKTSTIGDPAGKNVQITGIGIKILDGDKVRASYGASEIVLGDLSGDNILLEANRMAIRAGAAEKMAIECTKTTTLVTEIHFFDGARVSDELAPGGISMNRWTLNNPVDIKKIRIRTDSGKTVGSGTYSWSIYGSATLQIVISGDNQEAMDVDWTEYTTLEVTYESGNIVSNAKCDKFEAKDNAGKFVSFTEISSGTGTAKATTGIVSIQPKWWRCGNLVQLELGVAATGAVNPGKNLATGTINGIPRPITTKGIRAVSYYGNNANVLFIASDGGFTVRNCGNDALAKGNDAIGIFTYITDGTFTGGGA